MISAKEHERFNQRLRKATELVAEKFSEMGFKISTKKLEDTQVVLEDSKGIIAVDIDVWRYQVRDDVIYNVMDSFRPHLKQAWIVGGSFSVETLTRAAHAPFVRLYTFHDLGIHVPGLTQAGKSRVLKTTQGKIIAANYAPLAANILALQTLIDDRIAAIKLSRPNSDEGIAERDVSLAELEKLKRGLKRLRLAVNEFKNDEKNEADVAKATVTFKQTVEAWWVRSNERILDSSYATSLFVIAVSICSLAGVRGAGVTIIAGALAGGKPLMDSLKGLGKKLFS
jgi:hypothetical protein